MAVSVLTGKKALQEWKYYLLIVPSLAMVVTFSYFPAASALYHSFFDWEGGDKKEFVFLENFARAASDSILWDSFKVVAVLVVANVFKLIPSILTAVLIHRLTKERAQYVYRILVVIPMIVPGIVTLFVWKFFFDPNIGALNAFLGATGLEGVLRWFDDLLGLGAFREGLPPNWLGNPNLVLPSLIFWGFPWIGAVGVLIYLAGLQNIPQELYESADMDGAGSIRKFFSIELPLILAQVRVTLVLLFIGTLQGYGQQLLLLGENGGPERAGLTPGLWMFNRAFFATEFGYACSIGIIIFFVILGLTYLNNKYVRVEK